MRIDVTLAGEEIAITREPNEHVEYRDIRVALRDAFDAARRKIEDYVRRRRRAEKAHETPAYGRVVKIVPDGDYGFIETPDGREVYFHRNSVINEGSDALDVGTQVAFVETQGDK